MKKRLEKQPKNETEKFFEEQERLSTDTHVSLPFDILLGKQGELYGEYTKAKSECEKYIKTHSLPKGKFVAFTKDGRMESGFSMEEVEKKLGEDDDEFAFYCVPRRNLQ